MTLVEDSEKNLLARVSCTRRERSSSTPNTIKYKCRLRAKEQGWEVSVLGKLLRENAKLRGFLLDPLNRIFAESRLG